MSARLTPALVPFRTLRQGRRSRRRRWTAVALAIVATLVLTSLFVGAPFGPVYWFRHFSVTPNVVPTDDARVRLSAQVASLSGRVADISVTFAWVNATGVLYPIATAPTDASGAVAITSRPPGTGELQLVATFRVPGSSETVTSPVASLDVHLPPTL
jgi:hypothetical protein